MKALINNEEVEYVVKSLTKDEVIIELNDKEFCFDIRNIKENSLDLYHANLKQSLSFSGNNSKLELSLNGKTQFIEVLKAQRMGKLLESDAGDIVSPMPGKVFKVLKKVGDSVKEGDLVVVLEAMKMEHELRASKTSTINKVNFKVGDQVSHGDVLVELKE